MSQFKDLAQVWEESTLLVVALTVGTVVLLGLPLGRLAAGVARREAARAAQPHWLGLAPALPGALLAEAEETVPLSLGHYNSSCRGLIFTIDKAFLWYYRSSFTTRMTTNSSNQEVAVVFVVDDLRRPLREVVTLGLQTAEHDMRDSVTLPLMRTGKAAGRVETVEKAIAEMATAIIAFSASHPTYVECVSVVVYNQPDYELRLRQALGLA